MSNWVEYRGNRLIQRIPMESYRKMSRVAGYYGAAAAGPYVYNPLRARGGRKRYARRKSYARTGRYRKAGFYGRFGTGRGQRAQIEKKFLDTSITVTSIDSTIENKGSIVAIPQNATQNGRTGYKCVIKSIQWRGNIKLPAGASPNDDAYVYIIQDTQANGASPAAADIWTSTNASLSLRNIENGDRFKILNKTCISLNANAGVAAAFDGDQKVFEGFLKVNIPMVYNGATGAVTEMKSNNIMCWVGSVSTDDVMEFNCSYRVRYTDQ